MRIVMGWVLLILATGESLSWKWGVYKGTRRRMHNNDNWRVTTRIQHIARSGFAVQIRASVCAQFWF